MAGKLVCQPKQLSGPYSGAIIAFEFDPLNSNDIETAQQENDKEEEWQDKDDKIFVIDGNLTLFKVVISRDCEVLNRI